jgi:hypothetical protein
MNKKAARARHETVNHRFKQFHYFKISDMTKNYMFTGCLNAIAVITQLAIEDGEPLCNTDYNVIY